MNILSDAIEGTAWKPDLSRKDQKYRCQIINSTNSAILKERWWSDKDGITFVLSLVGPAAHVKISFCQYSIPQYKNGKDLYENALIYAEGIAAAHYHLTAQ